MDVWISILKGSNCLSIRVFFLDLLEILIECLVPGPDNLIAGFTKTIHYISSSSKALSLFMQSVDATFLAKKRTDAAKLVEKYRRSRFWIKYFFWNATEITENCDQPTCVPIDNVKK